MSGNTEDRRDVIYSQRLGSAFDEFDQSHKRVLSLSGWKSSIAQTMIGGSQISVKSRLDHDFDVGPSKEKAPGDSQPFR
ncbi:MAG: hypothetical protein ACRD28_00845, partial [Acidobacteriaceae bacterium]